MQFCIYWATWNVKVVVRKNIKETQILLYKHIGTIQFKLGDFEDSVLSDASHVWNFPPFHSLQYTY